MTKVFVIDTNTLISATLLKNSKPRLAINKAILLGKLALSKETFEEFIQVINRRKFDKYFISDEERLEFFNEIESFFIEYFPDEVVIDCIDPKDNKFLELAISCKAACVITGDPDLLVLHPFRNIPILNASDFIDQF